MLNPYIVLYRDNSLLPIDPPLAFACQAEDSDHAEEQCENAYPNCEVVWVVDTADRDMAYADYYGDYPSDWDGSYPL